MTRPTSRRRIRSISVQAALLGASAFALAGCDEPVDLSFFENAQQCKAEAATSTEFDVGDCDAAFAMAMKEHAVLAPRYDELALCEEQHGAGACGAPEEAGGAVAPPGGAAENQSGAVETAGGGPSFMPFFMGYMIGNMMSTNRGGVSGRPLYADTKGGLFSATGQRMGFAGPGSVTRAAPSALRAPANPQIAAPMTRSVVTARGGFGASRAATGFGG